jgi:SPP1 family predicted phage head-tail adaptor
MAVQIGELTERISILSATPIAQAVTSITRAGQVATVTTAAPHGFVTGDYVTHAGAAQAEYNGDTQITVTSPTVYTFEVGGTPVSPATGAITTVYVSDSVGGSTPRFYTLISGLWAKIEPMSAGEQLAAGGVNAIGSYNCTIRYRTDITPTMRVSWRRYLEASARMYEIHSVQPDKDLPRQFLDLEIGIVEGR